MFNSKKCGAFSAWGGMVLSLLCGCQNTPTVPPETAAQRPEPTPQAASQTRSLSVAERRQAMLDAILRDGRAALKRGRLTQPAEDNAYDNFQAVLTLDKDNVQAQAGLESIELALSDMVREALGMGHLGAAQRHLQTLTDNFPDSPLIEPARRLISEVRQTQKSRQVVERKAEDATLARIDLPAQALSQRQETITQILREAALRIEAQNARVIIYARNDAEGRWIYQTLKQAAGGYRIRGDIRRDAQPHLKLLEPLS